VTGVVVRRIRSGDAALLRDVRLRALAVDPESFSSTHEREAAFGEERWRSWAEANAAGNEGTTLLALRGREAVGLITSVRNDDEMSRYDIYAMWVAPGFRGLGVGRRLLDEIEAWARAARAKTLQLSVTDRAEAAQALYRSAGFEPNGQRTESHHTPGLVEIDLVKRLG
jgi:ribosomal protein S18 acetylase RimI-like enzyme